MENNKDENRILVKFRVIFVNFQGLRRLSVFTELFS
jgi:hypothetical protein